MALDENQRRKPRTPNKKLLSRSHKVKTGKASSLRNMPYLITMDEYLSAPYDVSVVIRTLEEDINLHWHDFLELEYVSSGEGIQFLNQQVVPFSEGTLCLLLPTDFHEVHIHAERPPFVYNVKFTEQMLDHDLFEILYNTKNGLHAAIPEDVRQDIVNKFLALQRECEHDERLKAKALKCILQQILIYLVRFKETESPEEKPGRPQLSVNSDIVVQAMSYIKRNYRNSITLKDIADSVHLSPNYLSGLFCKTAGITITEYLKSVRMRNAIVYLINSDKTIQEICEAVGYNSYEHFERLFKRRFGISPKEFRKYGILNYEHESRME